MNLDAGDGAPGFVAGPPPLALYVHLPWCRRKCPYCDFNSHALAGAPPETAYIDALLNDLDRELREPQARRPLCSVFIGGGTPSLFSAVAIARFLDGLRARATFATDAELTLEINPGALDDRHLHGYLDAGIDRLSLGVQSLSARALRRLGRIHDPRQARASVAAARRAGCRNLNLDLMYGLPGQSPARAAADLRAVLDLEPEHVSYYQLGIEPGTAFARDPPAPVADDDIAEMEARADVLLRAAGFARYEISAYARSGWQCRHNLNYWTFGDYLGIGAGAHGKLTDIHAGVIRRRVKPATPEAYLEAVDSERMAGATRELDARERILEFALNALRLISGVPLACFTERTGLSAERLAPALARARAAGLLTDAPDWLRPTSLGSRFLDDLLLMFDDASDHNS